MGGGVVLALALVSSCTFLTPQSLKSTIDTEYFKVAYYTSYQNIMDGEVLVVAKYNPHMYSNKKAKIISPLINNHENKIIELSKGIARLTERLRRNGDSATAGRVYMAFQIAAAAGIDESQFTQFLTKFDQKRNSESGAYLANFKGDLINSFLQFQDTLSKLSKEERLSLLTETFGARQANTLSELSQTDVFVSIARLKKEYSDAGIVIEDITKIIDNQVYEKFAYVKFSEILGKLNKKYSDYQIVDNHINISSNDLEYSAPQIFVFLPNTVKVTQTIDNKGVLAIVKSNNKSQSDKIFFIETDKEYADNTFIEDNMLLMFNGLFKYTTVINASKTVYRFRPIPNNIEFNEEFINKFIALLSLEGKFYYDRQNHEGQSLTSAVQEYENKVLNKTNNIN